MLRSVVVVALVAGALSTVDAGQAPAQSNDLSAGDRLAVAAKIHETVQQYFAHWETASRASVDAAYREYIGAAKDARDRPAFDLASLKFFAALHNGHSQFFDDAFDGRPIKFRLLEVQGRWVVIGSLEAALPKGTVVRSIDGRPVDRFVRDLARYVAASNDRLAQTHVFSYPGLFPEKIVVGCDEGRVVTIDRSQREDIAPALVPAKSEGRWLREGQLAYVRVPSFGNPDFERTAVQLVHQYASAPALIVDVRGNGGGATPGQLIAALMNRAWKTWQVTAPQPRAAAEQPPKSDAYRGRVIVLVDRFCGSACEDFVMPFKTTGRAVVIGETTQGSSGNPYRTDLGFGIRIAVGAVRYRFPDGRAFEGVGIAPDISVGRTIADIAAGRDPVLERAQQLGPGGIN